MLRRGDPSIRDTFSALFVTTTGGAPLICFRGVVTEAARALITGAGLPWPERALPYSNAEEYQAVLSECAERGVRVVFQHAHPSDPALDRLYWIPRDLLTRLNDKAELTWFVPASDCPPRRVMTLSEAAALPFDPDTTVVFKGSTERSTGSGGAVVIARTEVEARTIGERLAGCDRIVVEEYQPFERTMCLNWAADYTGQVHFIGSADQVIAEDGAYLSGWIGPEFPPPEAALAIGRDIMHRAAGLGYVGYAGFDVGILPGGRPLFFDLNFRLCTSTVPLLWYPEFRRRLGPDCHARIFSASAPIPFQELIRIARELTDAGTILPLGASDLSGSIWPDRPPTVRGLIGGRNRAETEARCEAIRARGLTVR